MKTIAWDVESHLIKPGCIAPKLVCLSHADGSQTGLLHRKDALDWFHQMLSKPDVCLVAHNATFDVGVMVAEAIDTHGPRAGLELLRMVFQAYEEGRLKDTLLRAKLLDIAQGYLKWRPDEDEDDEAKRVRSEYSLQALVKRKLGRWLPKEETWRLSYYRLTDTPIDRWPWDARDYAISDSVEAFNLFQTMGQECTRNGSPSPEPPDEVRQNMYAWPLHLMSMWGIRADAPRVASLRDQLEGEREAALEQLRPTGLIREDGSRDMKLLESITRLALTARDMPVELTPTGKVKTGAKILKKSGHPALFILGTAMQGMKLLSTYVPILESRTRGPVGCSYDPLKETGRTGSFKPNDQNPPRAGGVRECYIPRAGHLFAGADFDTAELRSLGQVHLDWFGRSELADVLRAGGDPHIELAAEVLRISPQDAYARYAAGDKELDSMRQLMKIPNFGFPGGMSADTLVEYAAGFDVTLSTRQSHKLQDAWFRRWGTMDDYFKRIKLQVGRDGEGRISQIRSGRIRGGVGFCQAANGYFQGLTADGAKSALWAVSRETYTQQDSPLWGSRPVLFLHDEIIAEVPDTYPGQASAAAERLGQVMSETMQEWIPGIPTPSKPVLMKRWYKGAKSLRKADILVPSKPVKLPEGGTKWVADEP